MADMKKTDTGEKNGWAKAWCNFEKNTEHAVRC